MNTKKLFYPYLQNIKNNRWRSDTLRICIPKKFCDFIKKDSIIYICPKCSLIMEKPEYHCIENQHITISIIEVEKWFLQEINHKEAQKLMFANRKSLIDFLEENYGYIQSNEPLLIIETKIKG